MRPLAAHCRLGLGLLLRAAGREADARAEVTAAREAFEAMHMDLWAERAARAEAREP